MKNNKVALALTAILWAGSASANPFGNFEVPKAQPVAVEEEGKVTAASSKSQNKKTTSPSTRKVTTVEANEPTSYASERPAMAKFPAPVQPRLQKGEIAVSENELNIFSFPVPVINAITKLEVGDNELARKPIYLNGNKDVAIEFKPGDDIPIQIIFELDNGTLETLYVRRMPMKGVRYVHKGPDVPALNEDKGVARVGKAANTEQKELVAGEIDIYKAVLSQTTPVGFNEIKPYPSIRYDRFTVHSVKSYSGQGKKVHVYKIQARPGVASTVSAPMFHRPGVTSVMVDGDRVDDQTSPIAIVIEEDTE